MKKLQKIIVVACMSLLSSSYMQSTSVHASTQAPALPSSEIRSLGTNPYTYAPLEFSPKKGKGDGRFWAGNDQFPAKAYVGETEYTDVVVLAKNTLKNIANKNLRKNKDYLGFYIDGATNQTYYLYGNKKNLDPVDDAPDADVLTQIAIKLDYGIGE